MNNSKISCGQLFVLMFITGMSEFIFFFPVVNTPSELSSGIASFLIAAAFQSLCLVILISIRRNAGKASGYAGMIPAWLYILYGLLFAYLSLRLLNSLLTLENEYADSQMNKTIFALLFAAGCIYAASEGIEAIARFSFFVLAALFIAAIFFVYCLAPVYDPGNIRPLSTSNNSITTALLSGCIQPAALFVMSGQSKGNFRSGAVRWIILSTAFFISVMILISGSIADYLPGMPFPAVRILDSSGILQRFRPFYIAAALGGMFCYISLSFTLILECMKKTVKKQKHIMKIFVVICVITVLTAVLLHSYPVGELFNNGIMITLTVIFSLLIPSLILLELLFKKWGRGLKKAALKSISIFLCCSVLLLFAGCSALQLNQRIIIQGLGLDLVNDEYALTAVVLDTEKTSEEGSVRVLYSHGGTPAEAIKSLEEQNGQSVLLSQCLFIMLNDKASLHYRKTLDYFIQDKTIMKTTNIMTASDSRSLIDTAIEKYNYSSEGINRLSESKAIDSSGVNASLFNVISCINNEYCDIQLPLIGIDDPAKALRTDGSMILSTRDENMVTLSREETILTTIINKKTDKFISADINTEKPMKINSSSVSYRNIDKKAKLLFSFDIASEGKTEAGKIFSFEEKTNAVLNKIICDSGMNIFSLEKGNEDVSIGRISPSEWTEILKNSTISIQTEY